MYQVTTVLAAVTTYMLTPVVYRLVFVYLSSYRPLLVGICTRYSSSILSYHTRSIFILYVLLHCRINIYMNIIQFTKVGDGDGDMHSLLLHVCVC